MQQQSRFQLRPLKQRRGREHLLYQRKWWSSRRRGIPRTRLQSLTHFDHFKMDCTILANISGTYLNKRRGIGQYPKFSRTHYFSAKKHTKGVLKVEVWAKKALFLCHLCSLLREPIKKAQHTNLTRDTYYQETPKVPPLNMSSGRIWVTYAQCQAWYFHVSSYILVLRLMKKW